MTKEEAAEVLKQAEDDNLRQGMAEIQEILNKRGITLTIGAPTIQLNTVKK